LIKEIYTAALGMQSQITRLETTANNIANAQTTGYKRMSIFERDLILAQDNLNNIEGDVEQDDPATGSYFDFSQGVMQITDNPLDLAIEGKGFFTLMDEDGKEYLTRGGSFRISEDGTILSMDGKKLKGSEGPISINREFFSRHSITADNTARSIRIGIAGEVFVNDSEVARISVVEPKDLNTLQRASASLFTLSEEAEKEELEMNKVTIRQGWLEGSNVNIVKEMVQMIELQRMYDAGSKVIQTNDNTIEKSIMTGRFV